MNPSETTRLSRRQLLKVAGLAGLAVLLGLPRQLRHAWGAIVSRRASRWGDRSTWGGRLPRKNDLVIISHRVVLDRRVRVAGVIIRPGGHLVFHPKRRATLASTGNVVVLGRLTMQTKRPGAVHRLVFRGIREGRFKGGGKHLVPSDIGLWVMERGRLRLEGLPKLGWTRAAGPVELGTSSIELQGDPIGWAVGDTVVISPTGAPGTGHHVPFDEATITAIVGRTITLSAPVSTPHPSIALGQDTLATAEVLNLTRTVRVEGTPHGRSHIFIHGRKPQRIAHVQIRHMGPRKADSSAHIGSRHVMGRYALHFHHCRDGSRGSLVEGVVSRDCGSKVFVPHLSHGVTFRDCVSFNTFEDAFWWDEGDQSNDIVWEHCAAALVRPGDTPRSATGFMLGAGTGNICVGCTAVGSLSIGPQGPGFAWPSGANQKPNVWEFQDCVAHNNMGNGIFVWQNDDNPHVIARFTGYHNGRNGIQHGAYRNRYRYEDIFLHRNESSGAELHASSKHSPPDPQTWSRVVIDQAGLSDYAIRVERHNLPAEAFTVVERCELRGYRRAGIGVHDDGGEPTQLEVRDDVVFEGNEFWMADECNAGSEIRWQGQRIRRKDQPGVFEEKWNASVSPS